MGCGASTHQVAQSDAVQQEAYKDLVEVQKKYKLSSGMVKRLPEAFVDADFDGTLYLDLREFQDMLGIEDGPLLKSLWRTVDSDSSREIDFMEFIDGMGKLGGLKSKAQRISYAFTLYDVSRNGTLDRFELMAVLDDPNARMGMTEQYIKRIINEKTCKNPDKITEQEFQNAVKHCPTLMIPCETIISVVRERIFGDGDGWNHHALA